MYFCFGLPFSYSGLSRRYAIAVAKEVICGPVSLPQISKAQAVQAVRAGFEQRIIDAPARAADLGVVRLDLDLHFLHRFNRRYDDGAVQHVRDRHAIEQVIVPTYGTAAQA